ncbi:hypothetical protein [Gelidibacter japonicus]|uniref:hypothetical protein n=1 Tax=Gelidibacter japonicus TaxID=1962232 RepID=UPI002AFF452C|nr:hypothetical protein [Gelidibacter japonicus]
MSSFSSYRQNPAPLILWVLFLLVLFLMTSCDISKKAIKNKTNTTTDKEEIVNHTKSNYDFGTINKDEFSLNYEPFDYSKIMWVITPRGDTIKSQNAKVTATKSNTKTQNKKIDNTTNDSKVKESQYVATVDKQKDKTEKFNSAIVFYIVAGVVILGMFALFLMYKSINKNTTAINAVLKRL